MCAHALGLTQLLGVASARGLAVVEALLKATPGALSAERLLEQGWNENVDPFTDTPYASPSPAYDASSGRATLSASGWRPCAIAECCWSWSVSRAGYGITAR